MVIAGAGGMAKEVLEVLLRDASATSEITFFDNLTVNGPSHLFDSYRILTSWEEVRAFYSNEDPIPFTLGLGNPRHRENLFNLFTQKGANPESVISNDAFIGTLQTEIGSGCCIMPGVVITSSVTLGKGVLVNCNATISHDCSIGDFTEIAPGANITGNCAIGSRSFIGANAVVLPNLHIGDNVIVGAGAVVTKDVASGTTVVGNPHRIIKNG